MNLDLGATIVNNIIIGAVIGIMPLLVGILRNDQEAGVTGMLICIFGALVLGVIGAVLGAIAGIILVIVRVRRRQA